MRIDSVIKVSLAPYLGGGSIELPASDKATVYAISGGPVTGQIDISITGDVVDGMEFRVMPAGFQLNGGIITIEGTDITNRLNSLQVILFKRINGVWNAYFRSVLGG